MTVTMFLGIVVLPLIVLAGGIVVMTIEMGSIFRHDIEKITREGKQKPAGDAGAKPTKKKPTEAL